ncbi:MAG: hypothetical protein QOE51_2536 [Actinoplanes sp.]|nr:hypothetical protein [Actinoplanes sp.]
MSRPDFAIGAKVTVKTTNADPVHLVTHPHVVIAAVIDRATGPAYLVEHIDQPPGFQPLRFGPFAADALTLGR